jgi:hypothetical protein
VARFLAASGALDTAGFNAADSIPGGPGALIQGNGQTSGGCPDGYDGASVQIQPAGVSQDIVVAGTQTVPPAIGGDPELHQPVAMRFTSAGALDATFAGGIVFMPMPASVADAGASAVAVQLDATAPAPTATAVVIAGWGYTSATSTAARVVVARFQLSGQVDPNFGNSGTPGVGTYVCGQLQAECGTAVATLNDTRIDVAGSYAQGGGYYMAVQQVDDAAVSVGAAPTVTVTVTGAGGSLAALFPVTLNAPSTVPVTVQYQTADGSAHAPADYTASSGSVTIPAGSTTGVITVPVNNGPNHAGADQSFSLALTGPVADVEVVGAPATVLLHHIGYRLVSADGGIFAFNAPFYGSEGGRQLGAPIVGIASDPATVGYWEVGADGGVFAFNAPFFGSEGGAVLNRPIVGLVPTPDDHGYWEVGSDGGIFAFGDAGFHGSEGGKPLNAPVVALDVTPSGQGYWMVAADGGIFAFGDAGFFGSMGGHSLNRGVVDMAPTPTGLGYWEVAADGGIFAFGDAAFHGSEGGQALNQPIVGIAPDPATGGYWMVAADGGIFAFDAPFLGSMGGQPLNAPIVGMAEA